MDIAQKLHAIEQIKQLKARYFRFIDTKDYEGLALLFAEDAWFDARSATTDNDRISNGTPEDTDVFFPKGREAIANFIRKATRHHQTLHHGHMPEIEILSEVTARGIVAMEDSNIYFRLGSDGRPERSWTLHGFGHYHETYSKVGDNWLIQTSRLSRLRVEIERNADRT